MSNVRKDILKRGMITVTHAWTETHDGTLHDSVCFSFAYNTPIHSGCKELDRMLVYSHEVSLYYILNQDRWWGESISGGSWFDLDEDDVKFYIEALDLKSLLQEWRETKLIDL